MKRRSLFLTSLLGLAVAVPGLAVAEPDQISDLKSVLEKAGRLYEDNISYDAYVPYFNGVLAGYGKLHDWAVITDNTGKAGHIVDVAVQFHEGDAFVYIPVKFSNDYWQRCNRLTPEGRVQV